MAPINWTNVTTAWDFLNTANTASSGYFWTCILYLLVGVMLISMIPFGFEIAILTSLFIGILAGIFLLYLGFISSLWLGVLVALELFFVLYILVLSPRNN